MDNQGILIYSGSTCLLRPIRLQPNNAAQTKFRLTTEGDWILNEALMTTLFHEFSIRLSSNEVMDPNWDLERLAVREISHTFGRILDATMTEPSFTIKDDSVVVGHFMYRKLPMVNDLRDNIDQLSAHNVIASLAGDEGARRAIAKVKDVHPSRPGHIPPASEYLILDADSSQNGVINTALQGTSFVVQGPPGTGKSQTITNLITTMMANGKSVLFVAEKRATIDAVIKRVMEPA